ncbi:hypothetical protein Lfu02_00110 [Longispora fulva]|uniref:Uncharacterized protein n=1 Tax=Longispora fulva TaxID=619741 RepID=A0A8J7GG92_9ACTN|nr:hypothetical protein [Longispora fulva]MBG6136117.1 hypothetical protein [Longispora fulva]GIG55639.1 hypothetical protein Lfu02_00110 [Longispora fulva]
MSEADLKPYRIERHGVKELRLYRGGDLIDIEHDATGDSRADTERWGSGVAWYEDRTVVERWEPSGDAWTVLTAVACRHVMWRWEDEGLTVWDEIDSTGQAVRHIEATTSDQKYTAAGSLDEAIAALDTGGVNAVRVYELTYGVVPETPYPAEALATMTSVSSSEFHRRWMAARSELEPPAVPNQMP